MPVGQNSPQRPAHGLYAEKLSGTSFTAPRHENKQTWLYRVLPSCAHPPFEPVTTKDAADGSLASSSAPATANLHYVPNQLRWDPFDAPAPSSSDNDFDKGDDFVSGLRLVAGAGDPRLKQGIGIYVYAASRSMRDGDVFYSADGDLLLVPQCGALDIRTELGYMLVRPLEVAVIPRGVRYQVRLVAGDDSERDSGDGGDDSNAGAAVRGYALELYQGHFTLPELGPIGSAGLANPRDFEVPVACFDEPGSAGNGRPSSYTITAKFAGTLHRTTQQHSPFDVVAWHGTYYPFKYDLGRFNTIGTISYDHPDPSIFTVLSAPSPAHGPGHAVADFVIFPPRWLVAEDTFRPPYFHRNTMSEFMGLVKGDYDAKKGGSGGFVPGGASLHNVMSGHGPDAASAEAARNAELKPAKVGDGSLAFMFESCLMLGVSEWGLRTCRKVQEEYSCESWGPLPVHFEMPKDTIVQSHATEGS